MLSNALAVEAVDLVKDFAETRAVDGVNLAVPTGSIYGLLGPNGAGKTTTLRMLIGIIERYENRFDKAEAVLKEGLALEPATEYDPKMLYILGRVYTAWDKTPEARTALKRVLSDYPKSPVTTKARELLASLEH